MDLAWMESRKVSANPYLNSLAFCTAAVYEGFRNWVWRLHHGTKWSQRLGLLLPPVLMMLAIRSAVTTWEATASSSPSKSPSSSFPSYSLAMAEKPCLPCATFSVALLSFCTCYSSYQYFANKPYAKWYLRLGGMGIPVVFLGMTIRQWRLREELKKPTLK